MQRNLVRFISLALGLSLLAGCGKETAAPQSEQPVVTEVCAAEQPYIDQVTISSESLEEEATALSAAPPAAVPDTLNTQPQATAQPQEATQPQENTDTQVNPQPQTAEAADPVKVIVPEASGTLVHTTPNTVIDYSNTSDGYVMVQFTGSTTNRLRARVEGPKTTYTYDIQPGQWTVFPLSDGNGTYQVKIFENVSGTRYCVLASTACTVTLKDEFAPFIRPNQYVDYAAAEKTLAKVRELTTGLTDPLKKVEAVYNYVVRNLAYDWAKASTVTSGYLPVLDTVLETKKGICFDYAALMTGMLRSQGIPCKLVVGYAGTAYHAWISVWTEATGWIEGAVYFDGASWHRMDPTFVSTGGQTASTMAYIGNGANYTTKYLY